jgi:hypothetical protein
MTVRSGPNAVVVAGARSNGPKVKLFEEKVDLCGH